MPKCEHCGKEVSFPFVCSYCGKEFCAEDRLPENHQCPKLHKEPFLHQKRKAMERETQKQQIKEGELYFVKEDELKEKERRQKTASRMTRNVKTIGILVISLIIFGIFILSWTNFFAQITIPHLVDTTRVEAEVFGLINEERASYGLPTLLKDEALATIAFEWSKHLAEIGNLTHGDFEDRIAQIGYSEYQCGEIIAMYGGWAPSLGREFVDMWLGSLGHYQIMMTPLSGYVGVGVYKGSQGFFAVVDFRFIES